MAFTWILITWFPFISYIPFCQGFLKILQPFQTNFQNFVSMLGPPYQIKWLWFKPNYIIHEEHIWEGHKQACLLKGNNNKGFSLRFNHLSENILRILSLVATFWVICHLGLLWENTDCSQQRLTCAQYCATNSIKIILVLSITWAYILKSLSHPQIILYSFPCFITHI